MTDLSKFTLDELYENEVLMAKRIEQLAYNCVTPQSVISELQKEYNMLCKEIRERERLNENK